MIAAILATDMSAHVSLYNAFTVHGSAYSGERPEDRQLLIKIVLHAADLSSPVRPFAVNCIWSQKVHREFQCVP